MTKTMRERLIEAAAEVLSRHDLHNGLEAYMLEAGLVVDAILAEMGAPTAQMLDGAKEAAWSEDAGAVWAAMIQAIREGK